MQSMEEIYRQHAQTVYRYLLAQTRSADLAEELTQETFYQAVRTAGQYRGEGKLTTWLCGIAKNVLRTYQRRHPPEEELDETAAASRTRRMKRFSRANRSWSCCGKCRRSGVTRAR